MDADHQTDAQRDEIIFRAQYSDLKVWGSIIVIGVPFFGLLGGAIYLSVTKEGYDYFWTSLGLLFIVGVLYVILDDLFFKEVLFYPDRVVKVCYCFGQRTIYYSTASVVVPEAHMRWLSSNHTIFESQDNGRPVGWRLPIVYTTFFFHSDTAKQIERIMDYLTEDTEHCARKFKKSTLPREVISDARHGSP